MTVLAILAATCYSAFHLGIRAVEKGEVAVVTAQRLRVASDILIRQIKSAVPYPARNEDEDVWPYFVGKASGMAFVTAAGLEGGGGLRRVVYRFEPDPPRLMIEESAFFSPDELGRNADKLPVQGRSILLDGFLELKFQYLLNDGAETEWRDGWDGQSDEMLPSAVRLIVKGLPGIETDVWGQEIPVMATMYGDNLGEVDDDIPPPPEDDEGAEGVGAASGVGAGVPGGGAPGGPDDDFGGDD